MRFHFLNVGNGDCSIIEHSSGRISVIDINKGQSNLLNTHNTLDESGGNYNQKEKPEHPIKYLDNLFNSKFSSILNGKTITRFILTHPDLDHMRGIKNLFDNFDVSYFWDTENKKDINDFSTDQDKQDWRFYKKIRENYKSSFLYRFDDCEYCKEDGITILSPTKKLVKKANEREDWNLLSYVILINENNLKILLPGDATDEVWEDILNDLEKNNKKNLIENIDVFVAPHHGRKSNRDSEIIKILKPRLTLIGNARSPNLNYNLYGNYSILTLTNNQAGNVVIKKYDNRWSIFITNKSFATGQEKNIDPLISTLLSKNNTINIAGRDYYYYKPLK